MGIWLNGFVKTTLEIPDELFRAAKAKAAIEGIKLKDLLAEGLRLRLDQPAKARHFLKFPIIKTRAKATLPIPDDVASKDAITADLLAHESSLRQ